MSDKPLRLTFEIDSNDSSAMESIVASGFKVIFDSKNITNSSEALKSQRLIVVEIEMGDLDSLQTILKYIGVKLIDSFSYHKSGDCDNYGLDCCFPLLLAAQGGHEEVVRMLIEAGSDVNYKNNAGHTALMEAAGAGHEKVVKLLIEAGSDVNQTDFLGFATLLFAARGGHEKVVKMLIEAGSDVNQEYDLGWNASMCSAYYGNAQTSRILLENGADFTAKSSFGVTALDKAKEESKNEETIELLEYATRLHRSTLFIHAIEYLRNHRQEYEEEEVREYIPDHVMNGFFRNTIWQSVLPPHITAMNSNSFARMTLSERIPNIVREIIEINDLTDTDVDFLKEISDEISNGHKIANHFKLNDDYWDKIIKKFSGMTYFEAPWFFVEMYFYRLLNMIPFDVFAHRKHAENVSAVGSIEELRTNSIHDAIQMSLWGNATADLSFFRRGNNNAKRLVVDESKWLVHEMEKLCSMKNTTISIVCDNVGKELLSDLLLATQLIKLSQGEMTIYFHVKEHPMFVSDATMNDYIDLVSLSRLDTTNIIPISHPFWNLPCSFCDLVYHDRLFKSLARSDLVVLKGDVNYRRFCEDLEWPIRISMDDIVRRLKTKWKRCKWTAPIVLLRAIKSDVLVGVSERVEPNGDTGVIQSALF